MKKYFTDYEILLHSAKEEIRKTVGKEFDKDMDSEKIYADLCAIFNNCAEYFKVLDKITESTLEPTSNADMLFIYKALEKEWGNLDFHEPLNKNYKSEKKKIKIFVPFNENYISSAIYKDNVCIKILPYLMTSYYLNLYRGTSAPVTNLLDKNNKNVSNLTRDKKDVANLFSLEGKINKFIKKKKPELPISISCIKDKATYIKYLSRPHFEKNSTLCKDLKITSFQFEHLFLAYIYSICTLACMNADNEICEKIDYKASFNLFNRHTLAFYSIYYCLLLDPDLAKETFNTNNLDAFVISTTLIKFLKQVKNLSDIVRLYNKNTDCSIDNDLTTTGVNLHLFAPNAKMRSQAWYKNAAIITAILLHLDVNMQFREYLMSNTPKIIL